MTKNAPLPELYTADAFAAEHNRNRVARYYLSTTFFPAARVAAERGEVDQVVISMSERGVYSDTLESILAGLGWSCWYREESPTLISLVAILPV